MKGYLCLSLLLFALSLSLPTPETPPHPHPTPARIAEAAGASEMRRLSEASARVVEEEARSAQKEVARYKGLYKKAQVGCTSPSLRNWKTAGAREQNQGAGQQQKRSPNPSDVPPQPTPPPGPSKNVEGKDVPAVAKAPRPAGKVPAPGEVVWCHPLVAETFRRRRRRRRRRGQGEEAGR